MSISPEEIVVLPVNRCIRVMKKLTPFKKMGQKQGSGTFPK
jgi:hypothetical protein